MQQFNLEPEEIRQKIDEINSWVFCNDRLPVLIDNKSKKKVLIKNNNGDIKLAIFKNKNGNNNFYDVKNVVIDDVLCWKYLWSFSRVSAFGICAYEWYLKYLEEQEKTNNYYGALGGLGHKVLEKFFKCELDIFDAAPYWEEHFNEEVPYDAPPNKYVDLKDKDYNLILEYFQDLDFDFDKYEILGVELEVKFKVGDYDFIGYIDLLIKDNETGEIIIIDHKSHSFKYLKKGGVSKGDKEDFEKFKKQLYLYSIPVKEKYGVYPTKLKWNMFKDHKWLEIDFNEKELEETKKWTIDQIHQIEDEELWLPNDSNDWYCRYLCSANGCPYRK